VEVALPGRSGVARFGPIGSVSLGKLGFTYLVASHESTVQEQAAAIAAALVKREPSVVGILLFGSVARGDAGAWSDIDLLVVTDGAHLKPSQLIAKIPRRLKTARLSVLSYPVAEFKRLLETGGSFVEHVRRESRILFDREGIVRRAIDGSMSRRPEGDDAELQRELDRLRWLEDPAPFNEQFLFVFAQLYAIGKSVVMWRLAREGAPEFNREKAFRSLQRRHPELRLALENVERLRPFYELVNKRRSLPLPFPSEGTGDQIRVAARAIRNIAA
jgi:predicted nucleotidyltransferase